MEGTSMTKKMIILTTMIILVGCSSMEKKELLPDGGLTTAQIYSGQQSSSDSVNSQSTNYYDKGYYLTKPLDIENRSMSDISAHHLEELRQDFKTVPNPEILGYVMPHFNHKTDIPVPGYFTIFKLYNREHYARSGEGLHE